MSSGSFFYFLFRGFLDSCQTIKGGLVPRSLPLIVLLAKDTQGWVWEVHPQTLLTASAGVWGRSPPKTGSNAVVCRGFGGERPKVFLFLFFDFASFH